MQIEEFDNIFEWLPDNITTVNVILDSVNFDLKEFEIKTESVVKNLDKKHAYNDDFFDTATNKVITKNSILEKYNLEII
ncbi:hypothetical protein SPONN_1674 [uncultured Candidatus Thioglobus sp.]|nr:hypothetical protein SPONN_1674 [uncultured Candidatus Thioglobus sp.]